MEFVGGERFNVQRDGDIVRVAVPLADSLQADLSDATVTVDFQLRTEGDGLNDVQLRQEPSVRFRFKSPVTLDEFEHGLLRAFHSLIEFAGDAYVPTLDLVAVQEDTHFVDGESGPTLSPPTEIAVAFKPRIPQKSVTRKPNEMAFTLSTLGDNWGTHLERWHVVNQKYKPTLDHLFSLRRTDSLPVELRFLSLAQAVESYHRRAFPERRREPSAEFEERKLRIVRCLDESDERWFRQAVQFANEPTLADRLRELWDLMPPQARQAIGERDEFARSTKNARNHLTHFTKERLAETEPRALFRSGSCLLLVLQVLLLRELKVDAESALSSVWGQQILAPLKR